MIKSMIGCGLSRSLLPPTLLDLGDSWVKVSLRLWMCGGHFWALSIGAVDGPVVLSSCVDPGTPVLEPSFVWGTSDFWWPSVLPLCFFLVWSCWALMVLYVPFLGLVPAFFFDVDVVWQALLLLRVFLGSPFSSFSWPVPWLMRLAGAPFHLSAPSLASLLESCPLFWLVSVWSWRFLLLGASCVVVGFSSGGLTWARNSGCESRVSPRVFPENAYGASSIVCDA